jgi:hypothetical protein
MKIYNFSIRYSSAILILSLSCVEPYDIPTDPAIQDILVVDGFMNATERIATITLSHVQHVEDSGAPTPETNARVSIESLTGEVYNLPEVTAGVYIADDLTIDTKEQYTLHVSTMNGKQYISETIRVYDTPAIDSLYVGVSNDGEGVNILLNTRDGKTRYYAWDYVETYEYNAPFYSGYKFDLNHIPINRGPDDLIYRCWRTIASSSITIGSSVRLAEDIIHAFPITTIPKGSRKTSVRYSILLKQRTIGELEYNYLYQLRKNLENIGGLFGVSPGTVTGNMREVNGSSVVLGYFSGAEVKEKRFFVRHEQLPDYLRVQPSREGCQVETTCFSNEPPMLAACSAIENVSESSILVSQVSGGAAGFAFTYTTSKCGDCRDHGGITQAPDFW